MSETKQTPFVYLDHSATTPVDPRVADVVRVAMLEAWGNPSSKYQAGQRAKVMLDEARTQIAGMLGCDKGELFFTSGGTEADNLALFGVMEAARGTGRDEVIVSSLEHSAVGKAAERLEAMGFKSKRLRVDESGVVDLADLKELLSDRTALVSIMHVNNEIGTVQPIQDIAKLAHDAGALMHADAVQSFGKLPVKVQELDVDLASISSHKIYGPKGVGALYVRKGVGLTPRQWGGGQERGVRTGTENVPGIAGFGEAARLCSLEMEEDAAKIGALRDKLYKGILEGCGEGVFLNGSETDRVYLNLNLRFDGVEGESLLMSLDMDGIAVSTGSACSSGSTKPSHVLTAIGLSQSQAHESLRLTLGRTNDEAQVEYAIERIVHHVKRLRAMAF